MSTDHGAVGGRGSQARVRGPLTGLAPEAKLVGLVAFLVVVAVTPPSRPWSLVGQGLVAVGVAVAALATARDIVRRLVVDLPLVVLAVTMALAGDGPRIDVVGISLSRAGLSVGLALLAKATIGVVATSAVAAATTVSETVAGLRRLRLPSWICDLVALTARQLQVVGDEIGRLRLAAAVRAGTRGRRGEWSAVGRALGLLFVRSVERNDRLQLALAARGGTSLAGFPAVSEVRSAVASPTRPPHRRRAIATPDAGHRSPSAATTAATSTAIGWIIALVPAGAALVLRMAVGS